MVSWRKPLKTYAGSNFNPQHLTISQLIFGHSISPTLWFQWNLIVLTILVLVLTLINNDKIVNLFLVTFSFLAFFGQYSGINYQIFGRFRYEIRYPLGRIVEMIPYCSAGLILGTKFLQFYNKLYENKMFRFIICILMLAFFLILSLAKDVFLPDCFGYGGVLLFLRTLCFTTFFWFIPIEILFEKINLLKTVTRYTMGIYCFHFLIGNIFVKLLHTIQLSCTNSYVIVLCIYLLSYFFCLVIDKSSNRYMKMLVN